MPGPALELKTSITRAGAGAGKTTGLVERVTEVFRAYRERGESPRVVLTTFTRKATQELKERLIARACRDQDPELLQFVSDPARLQIATIHGLLNNFLRQVGHLAGLDAGFQIVGEGEGRHLARLALREVILERGTNLGWLETHGFARVLTMCRGFATARREQGDLRPAMLDEVRAAADAEVDAWRDQLNQLSRDILDNVDDPAFQTYARALNAFATAWDGDCETIAVPRKPPSSKKKPELDDWHERVTNEIKAFKKEMERPCWARAPWGTAVEQWREFGDLAHAFDQKLDALKEAQARYEMNDLELKTAEILRQKPYLGAIFAENWDYWMIDEYQDTSPLQVACLEGLIGDRPRYYVGDPQQSIYLFRGAEVRVFDQAERAVQDAGGETFELRRNWRSRPELLEFINAFVADIGGHQFRAMDPRAAVEAAAPPRARLCRAGDDAAELDAVVARVGELLAGGARLEQICVLGRTHARLMDVSRALKRFDFPTHVHSSRGFESRREVIDARALWKFLVNPHDNLNLVTLLRSPWFNVADQRLVEWMDARPESLWRAIENAPDEAVSRLRDARDRAARDGLTRAFEAGLLDNFVLDLSLANDPAGRKESNLWKLIAKARALEKEGGGSALDFVAGDGGENALEAAEGDAASAQEPNCINLMTIHGAKGLQFDHVIVPGLGDAPPAARVPSFAAEDGIFHFPAWDESAGAAVPTPLDHLANRERGRREVEEFDRQLYVAVTRAKESLTLVWTDPARGSWASRSRFCAADVGAHVERDFAYEVTEDLSPPTPYAGGADQAVGAREPWGVIFPAAQERRAVTDLIGARADDAAAAPALTDPAQTLRRWRARTAGTRVHRALEALKYGRVVDTPEFAAGVDYVLSLREPPMRELIREGHTEWAFQVRAGRQVIEGQIDLWAKWDGRLYLVDYKTGSPEYRDSAFSQLEIYAWALRRFGHLEPARLVVIFPLHERIETREFDAGSVARRELEFGGA